MKDNELLRKDAVDIFKASLKAVDPAQAVKKYLLRKDDLLVAGNNEYSLSQLHRIYVVGAGKAGASMALALEEILGDRIEGGIVNVKYGHGEEGIKKIKINEAAHPVPDEAGIKGAKEIIKLLEEAGEKDLVICLISGGGSALLPYPVEEISLGEKQETTRLLLSCGADIREINAIRGHISRVKGGKLAKIAYPAAIISLILSDVIGDNISAIASGPTASDTSTFKNCFNILGKYDLIERVPQSVLGFIKKGLRDEVEETTKKEDPVFEKVHNLIIGSNILALKAAAERASELGYNSLILSSFIEGETRDAAKVHAAIAKEIKSSGNPIAPPACIVSGGETTVTMRGDGLGGRNQEFVLACAIEINSMERTVILSGGTDGTDGPTDAAGAICDGSTIERLLKLGMNPAEYLSRNDSYHFFEKLGDLIVTGPTRTNVMDVRLILVG